MFAANIRMVQVARANRKSRIVDRQRLPDEVR